MFEYRADWEEIKSMVLHLELKAAAPRERRALLECAPGQPIKASGRRVECSVASTTGLGAQRLRALPPAIAGR